MIDFIIKMRKIKETVRRGWALRGVKHPESVADHCFLTIVMAEFLTPKELDRNKVIRMLIVHDLAEIEIGDLTPVESIYKKKLGMEEEALKRMFKGKGEYLRLWRDFEGQKTPESRFAKQIDKLEGVLQALEYSKTNGRMKEFFDNAEEFFSSNEFPRLSKLYCEARKRFEETI
ncbi:MAG: HD domain-containing protein [Candidatus Woesearchaeota archaeon]